jgi:long-subunit fatty acid transport protein
MRFTGCVLVVVVVTLGGTSRVWAQTNEEAFEQFQWQMATPGAKATAMGGAFLASTSEVSAAIANPAGLMAVGRLRGSVEFGSVDFRIDRLGAIDSLLTGAVRRSGDTINGVPFAGIVIPLPGDRVTIAMARHERLAYRDSFHMAPRVVPGLVGLARATSPVDSAIDIRGVSYAASVGVALLPNVHVGLTVSADRLRADVLNTKHNIVVGSSPLDITETAIVTNQSRINDGDTGAGLTVGATYQPARTVSVGLVFSKGPSFHVSEDFLLNPGRLSGVNQPLASEDGFPTRISLNIPDRLSAGVSVRPHARLMLAFDATHITYSDLAKGLTPVFAHDLVSGDDYAISNGTELHGGGEFNVGSDAKPVFLRAGVFTNPDHRLQFVGTVRPGADITPAQAQRTNAIEAAVFNLGNHDTQVAGTVGVGLALGRHAQADAAYVWKQKLVVSLSLGL